MSTASAHEARVAIEALRAGTPNRAAIRLLGTSETAIATRFAEGLDRIWEAAPPPGQIIAGGFGAGKSHLLGTLREQALARGIVVSWVTVSKETPLSHTGLMFAAAMRNANVPGTADDVATAALNRIQRIPGAVQALELWTATQEAAVAPMFGAVAHLLGRNLSPALIQGIEAFLCGGKPPSAGVRARLAELGARGLFELTGMRAIQLDLQRPRFMAQLLHAAGFKGWCVMIDEVELIGRYGPAQRASAYTQLARWLGLWEAMRIPGLYAVAAITDDFTENVIDLRRDDEKLPDRLRGRALPDHASVASAAMRAIRGAPLLKAPDDAELARHAETLRDCYQAAYGWPTPPAAAAPRQSTRSMRQHIRGWITEWDMQRLFGRSSGIEISTMPTDYSEDSELSSPPEDSRTDG